MVNAAASALRQSVYYAKVQSKFFSSPIFLFPANTKIEMFVFLKIN